jgi:hypothetical protein
MKGHEEIIRMRMVGKMPEWVHIYDYPCDINWQGTELSPVICVDSDFIKTLDLRFLINMKVCLSSPHEKRAKDLFQACKDAKVALVAACHIQDDKHFYQQTGWADCYANN